MAEYLAAVAVAAIAPEVVEVVADPQRQTTQTAHPPHMKTRARLAR